MNSIRNSSDHAASMALALVTVILVLAAVVILGMQGAKFDSGPPKGLEIFNK